MGKVTAYHPGADRFLECSESAFRDVYATQGWQLVDDEPAEAKADVAEPEPVDDEPDLADDEPATRARRRR